MALCADCKSNNSGMYNEPCQSCYSVRDARGIRTKPEFKRKGESSKDTNQSR